MHICSACGEFQEKLSELGFDIVQRLILFNVDLANVFYVNKNTFKNIMLID